MNLKMDYSLTLEAMIAAGFYQEIDSGIDAKRFPLEIAGEKETEVELVQFPEYSGRSTDLAWEILKAEFIPAGLEHLLAFGAQHPGEQCKYPIAALDSVISDHDTEEELVPYLGFNCSRRSFKLARVNGFWDSSWRYLVIPIDAMAGK